LPGDLIKVVPTKSVDIVTSIFVLSALPPEKFVNAIENIKSCLRPSGLWLFRDYAVTDAAQARFKSDRKLSDNLFVRQDGTLSYFFDKGISTGENYSICDVYE
jgi:methyltransferase-like protein 6